MQENRLDPKNCNTAKCKTCIFGPTPLKLEPHRMAEIRDYLARGTSSHICHTTNKTCYGALEFQAQIFSRLNIIPENSVKSLLDTAQKHLKPNNI